MTNEDDLDQSDDDTPLESEALQQEQMRLLAEATKVQGEVPYISPLQAQRLRRLIIAKTARQFEALKLYEPLVEQDAFHKSTAKIRLLRGSNRGGKTLPAAVEVARAVTYQDPYNKWPKEGRFWCIGKDERHIGQTMWRKLSRPREAFRLIRDKVTGLWRAYRPWAEPERLHETKGSPALIPDRMIKRIAWTKKNTSVPSYVVLNSGWEISFFSSLGKPAKGADIDGVWLDEEIVDRDWVPEMLARLIDRFGNLIWSATPEVGTDQLYELHQQAESEALKPANERRVEEFVVLLRDNPHVREEAKQAFLSTLTEEQYSVKYEGEFAFISRKVYQEYSNLTHGVPFFTVPPNWARFMAVDPGHQICAVLFAAVPPPEEGDYVYLYDELYIENCNAALFAEKVAQKAGDQSFEAFIIDMHMGIHTEMGVGKTVATQYSEALRAKGIRSARTGYDFFPGNDDIAAGITAVHGWLRIRDNGSPKLRVVGTGLPAFEWEIRRYRYNESRGFVQDKPNKKQRDHLMDALRYLAMYDPKWRKPQTAKMRRNPILDALEKKRTRKNKQDGGDYYMLGSGGRK